MDAIDRKIVAIMQDDGRVTLTELAQRVDLSVSRCQRRVRELEQTGVIRGYRAMIDAETMGFGFEVLAFATLERPEAIEVFDAAVTQVPQIIEAQRLFGEPDYLLRVVSPDLRAYQELYDTVLVKLPGLRGLNSTIVMKETVPRRALPLASHRSASPRSGG